MHYFIIIAKLLIAAGLGFLIGRERKKNDKPGGSRTFAIITLGSALIGIMTLELANMPKPDGVVMNFTRLISYTLVAMSFIGNGILAFNRKNPSGLSLTSASTLFTLVPIGICIGLGYFFLGITTGIITYIILDLKYWMED